MSQFKRNVGRKVRNLGLINFQYIERSNSEPLQRDDELNGPPDLKISGKGGLNGDLWCCPTRPLTYPKVLRARGIKVIVANTTEMRPVDDEVRRRFFELWQSRWERSAHIERIAYEAKAQKIILRERSAVQRETIAQLTSIFSDPRLSHEAIALHVLQALETAAADPLTRQFLPNETIYMLEALHRLLLPGDGGTDGSPPPIALGSD